jgi:hypothetical protein
VSTGSDEPDGEQQSRGVAGQRAQSLSGIGCRGDVVLAGHEEGGARGQDDEIRHDLREDHPRNRVPQGVFELKARGSLAVSEETPPHADLLLDFLAGLPEEEVGRDGGAEQGDENADVFRVERDRGDQRSEQNLHDVGPREQGCPDVGKQGQGQPLEDLLDEAISAEDLKPDDPQADRHDEHARPDRH